MSAGVYIAGAVTVCGLTSTRFVHNQSRKPPACTGIFVARSPGPVFPEVSINSHFLKKIGRPTAKVSLPSLMATG